MQTARDFIALNQGVVLVDPFVLLIADRYPNLAFVCKSLSSTTSMLATNACGV